MRIVFLGSPLEVLPVLKKLEQLSRRGVCKLVGVVSQPARPSGRKQTLQDPPVAAFAKAAGLPLLQPEKARDEEFLQQFAGWQPDIALTAAYGQILSGKFLAIPQRATINIHPSMLPAYRGATPVPAALLDDCRDTGVSLLFTVKELDAGALISQKGVAIHADETADVLLQRLFEIGADMLPEALALLEDKNFSGTPQDNDKVSHCKKFSKLDGALDWSQAAATLAARHRAFYPWPGSYALWNQKRVLFHKLRVADLHAPGKPGSFVFDKAQQSLLIATRDGSLQCDMLQLEGAKTMTAAAFWNGPGQQGSKEFVALGGKHE